MSEIAPEAPAPAAEAPPAAEPVETIAPSEVVEPAEPVEPAAVEPAEPAEPAAVEPADPFADYGGKEEIERAVRLWKATQSDEGVIQVFFEAGQAMGLGLKEMQALFDAVTGATPEPETPAFDPDEPLTRGEFEALQQQQRQSELERQAAQIRATAKVTVQAEVDALGLDPASPTTKIVLQNADAYLNGDFSPESIKAAIRRGHADYTAQVQKDAERLLQIKREQAAAVPSAPAGSGAPSEPPPAEPKNVAEAALIVRRKLGLTR